MTVNKDQRDKTSRLEEQYARNFGQPVRRSANLSGDGRFVMPTAYKPAVITYTAGTVR